MKRFILACAVSALAFSFLGVASASASSGAATHYTAAFSNVEINPGVFVSATCSGNRIVNNGGGTKDVETCIYTGDTSAFVAGTYKSTEIQSSPGFCMGYAVGVIPFFFGGSSACWSSDYDGQLASSWKLSFAPAGGSPGTWINDIVAYYNS
jgi:hypothetical protein